METHRITKKDFFRLEDLYFKQDPNEDREYGFIEGGFIVTHTTDVGVSWSQFMFSDVTDDEITDQFKEMEV